LKHIILLGAKAVTLSMKDKVSTRFNDIVLGNTQQITQFTFTMWCKPTY